MRRKSIPRRFLDGSLLLLLIVVAAYPTVWLLLISLQPAESAYRMPPKLFFVPNFLNYRSLLGDADFRASLFNSLAIAIPVTLLCVVAGALAGFALSRLRSRLRNGVTGMMLVSRLVPSFAIVIPTFLIFDKLHLLDAIPGIVLAMVAFHLPIAVLIMYRVCDGIPAALDEAAKLEGASRRQTLQYVVVPIARPGLAASAVITFVLIWNEFLFVLVLAGNDVLTLPVTIATFETQRQILWGPIAAASIIATIPMLAVVLVAQRALLSGIGAGAVRQ